MNRFRPIVALVLLFLWGTATVHCGLELDGLLGMPSHKANPSDRADSGSTDTDPEGCAAIENGHFETHFDWLAVSQPTFIVEFLVFEKETITAAPTMPPMLENSHAPPELTPRWSFDRRASSLSRAPNVVA